MYKFDKEKYYKNGLMKLILIGQEKDAGIDDCLFIKVQSDRCEIVKATGCKFEGDKVHWISGHYFSFPTAEEVQNIVNCIGEKDLEELTDTKFILDNIDIYLEFEREVTEDEILVTLTKARLKL